MQENQSSDSGRPADPAEEKFPAAASATADADAASDSATSVPTPRKSVAAWCAERGREWAQRSWQFVCAVGQYYWGIREALWEFIAGHAPDLMSESIRMREVRLAPYESHALAEFDSGGWTVTVPGRCVVCGEPTPNPPVDENLLIDDAARAFWVPVGTVVAGAALGLVLWDRRFLLLAIVLGPFVGYVLRGKVAVRLRVTRCDQHVTRTRIPQVLAWGNTLVLRFGHKLLRKIFLYGEPMGSVGLHVPSSIPGQVPADPNTQAPSFSNPTLPATSYTSEPSASPYTPETIPLADSPAPEDATIRHDRPPVFDRDEDSPSPLVP
jgi:hypothetical protein